MLLSSTLSVLYGGPLPFHSALRKMTRSMYRLYDGGAWSTGVASFDRARGRSPSGLSKLKPRVCNQ